MKIVLYKMKQVFNHNQCGLPIKKYMNIIPIYNVFFI